MKETVSLSGRHSVCRPATLSSSPTAACRSLQSVIEERDRSPRYSPDVILSAARSGHFVPPTRTERFVAMGLSTGGVETLEAVLPYLPEHGPAMVIVLHMPESAGDFLVRHINKHCKIEVRKACHGDQLRRGVAFLAPGEKHMLVRAHGNRYFVELRDGPLVSLHRPSIDVLFRSVSYAGDNALGLIMTGLGDDGVLGLKEMRDCGAHTVAQDQVSCVAASMPRAAVQQGAAKETASLARITELISRFH